MSLTYWQLKSKCDHIISYGHNWGFVFVRESIRDRKKWIREHQREIKEYKKELEAYQQLLKTMERTRQVTKGE